MAGELLLWLTTPPGAAATPFVEVQEWVRIEAVPDRTTFTGEVTDLGWLNRGRLGVGLRTEELTVFAQIQDVRRWGSEYDPASGGPGSLTDFSADGLDLHQVYARAVHRGITVTVGRQEIDWHNQRLIGTVGWTPQARSLDAIRLAVDGGEMLAEAFYAVFLDRPNPITAEADPFEDMHLLAGTAGILGSGWQAHALGILLHDGWEKTTVTTGVHARASGPLGAEVDAFVQLGARDSDRVFAYLVGLQGDTGTVGGPARVSVGVDVVSGDPVADDGTDGRFDTLLGTNHKFYGHMDYYLNLPAHTQGRGLLDAYGGIGVADPDVGSVQLTAHLFRAVVGLEDADHGLELDLDASAPITGGLDLVGGGGVYLPGRYWGGGSMAPFAYLQLIGTLAADAATP